MRSNFLHTALISIAILLLNLGLANVSAQKFDADCAGCQPELGGTAPSLGAADTFAVLAGTTVTNTGSTVVVRDLGVSPGTAVTGFAPTGPGTVMGAIYTGAGSFAGDAQIGALAAYNDLAAQACDTNLTGQDLGGLILFPGVYCFDTSAQLTGILTLDGDGQPNPVFVFQIGSTITTAPGSSVLLIGDATACNVFYQVGSSATLETNTAFQGTIVAAASITLQTGTSVFGRVLALDGAVTLDTNDVTICNLIPSAGTVSVSGRILTADGAGLASARIALQDSNGASRTVISSPFGYYVLEGVQAGETYLLSVTSKRYQFESRVITVSHELTDIDFVAVASSAVVIFKSPLS